jgi:hypothetical protein
MTLKRGDLVRVGKTITTVVSAIDDNICIWDADTQKWYHLRDVDAFILPADNNFGRIKVFNKLKDHFIQETILSL